MLGFKILTALCAVTVLIAVSEAGLRMKRVVGGSQYAKGDYPFHVSLWYMGENNFYTANTPDLDHTCGGALVGDRWVLTAAQCFDDDFLPGVGNTSLWNVVVGMYGQKSAEEDNAQFREIEKVFFADDYSLAELYGDVALLKLKTPVDLTDERVSTVEINDEDDCPEVGMTCTVIGWGQVNEEPFGQGSEFPHEVDVDIVNTDDCREAYKDVEWAANVFIGEGSVCAGLPEGGADACAGDAGSPLLCRCDDDDEDEDVVVGIVSYGEGCARPGFPGVYSKISHFEDWIEDTIEENS